MQDVEVVAVAMLRPKVVSRLLSRGIQVRGVRGNKVGVFLEGKFLGRVDEGSVWELDVPSELDPAVNPIEFRVKFRLEKICRAHPRGRRCVPQDVVTIAVREISGKQIYPSSGGYGEEAYDRCVSRGARLVMASRIDGSLKNIWICEINLSDLIIQNSEAPKGEKRFAIQLKQRTSFFGPVTELPDEHRLYLGDVEWALGKGVGMPLREAREFMSDMRPFADWEQ